MAEQRRSGIPNVAGGSSLSKRAPSPSNAAFSSSRPSGSGPLGGYRPASRNENERSTSVAGDGTASRFGFASTSSTTNLASRAANGKRTASIAGLRETDLPESTGNASKRTLLTGPSATVSSKFPKSTPAYDTSMLESEFQRRELLAKQAYEKLQNEFKASGRDLEILKQERVTLLRQWEESNSERKEEKDSFEEQRKFLNDRVNALQQQNQELKICMEEAQLERSKLAQTSHDAETKHSHRITTIEFELAAAKAQAEEQRDLRSKEGLALQMREKEWEEDKLRLERREAESRDSKLLTGEFSSLLTQIHKFEAETLSLQQENRILKTKSESIETLKEQKRDLEERLVLMDGLRRKHAEAQTKIDDLEAAKEEWNRKLSSGGDVLAFESTQDACSNLDTSVPSIKAPSPLTPSNLSTYLSSLQGAISGLSVRSRALEERVDSVKKQCISAEQSNEQESNKRARLEEELASEKTERLKSAKMAEAAKMEVESYVRLLDSFQEEARNQSTEYNTASAEHIQVLEGRLKTSEASLQESLLEADQLRKLTQGSGGISKEERVNIEKQSAAREKELLESLNESKQERSELEKQCVELGKINDQLYLRVGRGEFDQSKERCLELKDNPVSQDRVIRTTTLNALRKENEELLGQIEELSKKVAERGGVVEDGDTSLQSTMIPVQTLENQRREYEKLEETMRNRDKAFDRLKEAFAAKAIEYVAAVKALFGYDMHVISKGKVKLRSIYARTSKGTSLTFESGEDNSAGKMKLIGEARQGIAVGNLQDYWLGNDRFSVPCFLAALQLELYEGTTRAVRPTWEAEEDQ